MNQNGRNPLVARVCANADVHPIADVHRVAVPPVMLEDAQKEMAEDTAKKNAKPEKQLQIEKAIDDILAAFANLVVALMAMGHFDDAYRIMPIASSLQRLKRQTVDDFLRREARRNDREGFADDDGVMLPEANIVGGGRAGLGAVQAIQPAIYAGWGAGNDGVNVQRELLLMMQKAFDLYKETKHKANEAATDAEELHAATALLSVLPKESQDWKDAEQHRNEIVERMMKRVKSATKKEVTV